MHTRLFDVFHDRADYDSFTVAYRIDIDLDGLIFQRCRRCGFTSGHANYFGCFFALFPTLVIQYVRHWTVYEKPYISSSDTNGLLILLSRMKIMYYV